MKMFPLTPMSQLDRIENLCKIMTGTVVRKPYVKPAVTILDLSGSVGKFSFDNHTRLANRLNARKTNTINFGEMFSKGLSACSKLWQ